MRALPGMAALCLALSACAAVEPTQASLGRQTGLLVQAEQEQGGKSSRLRVAGASWLNGGDPGAAFDREATALAWKMGCRQYRIEGRQERVEATLLGSRRVIQALVVCP